MENERIEKQGTGVPAEVLTETHVWPIDKLVFYANNPRKNDGAVDRMCAKHRPRRRCVFLRICCQDKIVQPGVGLLNGELVQIFASPLLIRTSFHRTSSYRVLGRRALHHFSPASAFVCNVS